MINKTVGEYKNKKTNGTSNIIFARILFSRKDIKSHNNIHVTGFVRSFNAHDLLCPYFYPFQQHFLLINQDDFGSKK